MKIIPIPIVTFALSVAVIGLLRSLIWYFFGMEVEKTELWSAIGIGTSAGLLYQALPATSQRFLTSIARGFLSKRISAISLSVILAILLVPTLTLSYVDISWRGPNRLTILINTDEKILVPDESLSDLFRKRKYGLAFSSIEIRNGNWVSKKFLYPLTRREIQVPYWVTSTSLPRLLEVEEQLEMTFFQFFEARYLNNAKNKLSALSQQESQHQAIERLDLVYEILHIDFLDIDLSDKKGLLLEAFTKRYPSDPWDHLLKAANYYGDKNYLACAETLKTTNSTLSTFPQKPTENFFRGVCLLKASRDAKIVKDRDALSDLAIEQFQSTHKALSTHDEGIYRSLALPSSIHFQGIANYYRGRTDETIKYFKQASEFATGGLKARTLNGIGYIQLSRGNLEQAEIALLEAMDSDPTFPLARSNYGYVLMDKGDLKKAREIFFKNASDERLKLESYRDVVLAKLALVHLSELAGVKVSDAIGQYEPILTELNIQDFDGVAPDELRLANIHKAIAKNIYLSKDYYGLEIYALALLTRAYLEADDIAHGSHTDIRVSNLLESLSSDIASTKSMVSQDWLNRPQRGWFATIDQYQKRERKISAKNSAPGWKAQTARP